MANERLKNAVRQVLEPAGIEIDGENPWDIRVRDDRFYRRTLIDGSLGLGESYMDGWWDCERIDEFFFRLLPTLPESKLKKHAKLLLFLFRSAILDPGRKSHAFEVGERHYDLGNALYESMLDGRMVYSCGYWKEAESLDEAQEAKLDLICRKLRLKPGEKILDIGCGWGSLLKYAAEKYGTAGVGITVSREQARLAREFCEGLPVEIRVQDYRDVSGIFDHVASVGMFEHVGCRNYRVYMESVRRCLKDGGLFLLHTIGNNLSNIAGDLWVNRYIFPNSIIPSIKQIGEAAEGIFVLEDLQNFGLDYDRTLRSWLANFEGNWDLLKSLYDERFYRMWRYYLQMFSGAFRARYLQVWQIVLSGNGVPGGYHSIR